VLSRSAETGNFRLELTLGGKELKIGLNTLDLVLRDRLGAGVEGAQLTVTPWMPTMGHGVWEKPVVRERGGGNYHVDNITVIMAGTWDLKVAVQSGAQKDTAVFSFEVAEAPPPPQKSAAKPREGVQRSVASYTVPKVTLLNQDGKKTDLASLVEGGKPVFIDFIYTTCTTVCPILSASFANLRAVLGEHAREVQLISITIDPEHDRPEQLKAYGARFKAGEGWDFLTGSRDDIGRVLRAFDAFVVDKMSHEPMYFLHGPNSDQWVRIKGLARRSDLMNELRLMKSK
jgi:protein SCO1/2